MSFYVGQTKSHFYRVVCRRLSPGKENAAQLGKLYLVSSTLPEIDYGDFILPSEFQERITKLRESLEPTDVNYKEALMTFHTALVVDEKYLFEYEDGNEYYSGPKDWGVEKGKFEWIDIKITDPNLEKMIKGETDESPDKLDRSIKVYKDWTEEGHYSVLSHNCQMFTQLCVNLLLSPILVG